MREIEPLDAVPLTWACLICGEVHAIDHAALWTADGAFAVCLGCEQVLNARAASPRVVGRVFTKLYGLDTSVEPDGNRVVIETGSFGLTDPGEPSPDGVHAALAGAASAAVAAVRWICDLLLGALEALLDLAEEGKRFATEVMS